MTASDANANYDSSNIQILEGLEAVRKRDLEDTQTQVQSALDAQYKTGDLVRPPPPKPTGKAAPRI